MMNAIGSPRPRNLRTFTLIALGAYVSAVTLVNAWRFFRGGGSAFFLAVNVVLLGAVLMSMRSKHVLWRRVGDWLPLIALPVLYSGLPWAAFGPSGRMFDGVVQGWDRALFGTDPARTLAGALPSRLLSEVLHLAYLMYYAIIYLPPVVMYADRAKRGYYETVFAFTLTMVASFVAFSVFPVEGPRFAWPAPPGVPDGPVRSAVLFILQNGSSRGTAFPSSHVAIALAQSLSSLAWRRSLGLGLAITTALLGFGAVYGGFHYAVDILAGAALGSAAWFAAKRVEDRDHRSEAGVPPSRAGVDL